MCPPNRIVAKGPLPRPYGDLLAVAQRRPGVSLRYLVSQLGRCRAGTGKSSQGPKHTMRPHVQPRLPLAPFRTIFQARPVIVGARRLYQLAHRGEGKSGRLFGAVLSLPFHKSHRHHIVV